MSFIQYIIYLIHIYDYNYNSQANTPQDITPVWLVFINVLVT